MKDPTCRTPIHRPTNFYFLTSKYVYVKQLFSWAIGSLFLFSCNENKPAETVTEPPPAAETKVGPAEFADPKYSEIGKKGIAALASGDIDTWMTAYADNAVYLWNNGDSIAGKKAITEYWRKRRGEVIDSLTISNAIWLPIKVNQPQSIEAPGVWLLSWYQVSVKYKTGKYMSQWLHTDQHFDANDKIDRVIQYIDRGPIMAATKK